MYFNSVDNVSGAQRGDRLPQGHTASVRGKLNSDKLSTASLYSKWQGCGVSRGPMGHDEICPSKLGPQDVRRNPGIQSWAVGTLVLRLLPAHQAPMGCGKDCPAFPPLGREKGPPGLRPLRRPCCPALTPLFVATGLSFCQLQKQQILLSSYLNSTATSYLPQCQDSGDYEPVQCDLRREQCWCVDTEGMEVYGTRQLGRPTRCKSQRHQRPLRRQRLWAASHIGTKTGSGLPEKRQRTWPSTQRRKGF